MTIPMERFILSLVIAGTLLLVISNSIKISTLSARIEEIEDRVSPSLQKMDNRINLLNGEVKKLEDHNEKTKQKNYKSHMLSKEQKILLNKNKLKNRGESTKLKIEINKKVSNKRNWELIDTKDRKLQMSQSFNCASKPMLSPISDLTGNIYDERISKLLEVFESLSSHDAIHNDETSQYKAACFMIYDDVNQMKVEDELTIERFVLYLFLISTKLLTWGQGLPSNHCHINGVSCYQEGYIAYLIFSSRNLVGTIPTELGHLRYLNYIDLYNNDLTGTLPSQLGRLTYLEELLLYWNNLNGTIPSEIGNLKILKRLWLHSNDLSGSIPSQLFDATELIRLNLHRNRLTGSISTYIGQLDKLEILDLYGNQLTGSLPTQVGNMSSLEEVSLSNTQLVGQMPTEIGNWKNISGIDISSNQLTGTLPDVFDNLTQLLFLFANDNAFTGEIPSSIWRVDSLYGLQLQNNDVYGSLPDDFCKNRDILQLDDSNWFVDSPKVKCTCCDSCQFWDPLYNPTDTNTKCPDRNILNLWHHYDTYPTYIKDVHTNDKSNSLYAAICISPTGCYEVNGYERNSEGHYNPNIPKEFYFGYWSKINSIILSNPQNPTCDAVDICGKMIDSNHPRRSIVNYFFKIGLSDISILDDPESYQYKALCWMMGDENDVGIIDQFDECDGTLLQFCIIGLFFSSTNYLNSLSPFSSSDHLCNFDGIECDQNNQFIEGINLHKKDLTGTLISEIGLLESLKKIDLSENQMRGEIDEATFNKLPKLEIFDINNNTFEGEIPKSLLSHPSLKELKITSNLFVGTLPSSLQYSSKLESFEVADNLLQGGIPDDIFNCLQLHTIDISQNKFNGTLPTLLGELSKLKNLRFNENELVGSLPTQMFQLTQMQILMLQSNKLTGSIPTLINNFNNLTKLVLNHNNFKGNIPPRLQDLTLLETLHLHHNQLTGTAPNITTTNVTSYITDCGFPNYALPKALTCESCTMCCNSDDACQQTRSKRSIWKTSIPIMGLTIIGFICMVSLVSSFHNKKINLQDIYTDTSVHSFIFAKNKEPKIVYFLSMCLQVALFVFYMQASDINKEATDWKFTFQCPDNSIDCINLKKTNTLGWLMFTIVILCLMGPDVAMSIKQLNQGIVRSDATLLASGIMLLFLSIFAIYSSFVYNRALAEKNTDLILNAVVLIFIMELDDQIHTIFKKLFPEWTKTIEQEIESNMN